MHSVISLKAVLAVVLLAFVLAGCGERRQAAALNAPQVRSNVELYKPSAATPPSEKPLRLQGPRAQWEIDNLFAPVSAQMPLPPVRSSRAALPEIPDDGKVVAEPSWDVNIAREWHHIVVHHSASATGSAASFDKAHRERGWDGLGYHFVIGNGTGTSDGQVETGYRWTRQLAGAHAGNAEYNQHGIGICLVGDFEHGSLPSPRQVASLRRLVRFLQVKTGIPSSEVVAHDDVPGKSTLCPGDFNVAAFRASLGKGAIGVPIHYASVPVAKPAPAILVRTGAACP